MGEVHRVASRSDIPEGESLAVDCGDERVAIFNIDGEYYAISDSCPHAGGPLSQGWVDGYEVTCPWHGWSFGIKEESRPNDGVCRYKVHMDGDEIMIELPD